MIQVSHCERRAFLRRPLISLPFATATVRASGKNWFASRQQEPDRQRGSARPGSAGHNVPLAFVSRPGENRFCGDRIDIDVCNTRVVAGMISDRIGCDAYEIVAADPYLRNYRMCAAPLNHSQQPRK